MDADLSDKVGAAFVTAGGISAGEEVTMLSTLRSLMIFRLICVGAESWESAFAASAIVYEDPFGSSPTTVQNFLFPEQCYHENSLVHPMFLQKVFSLSVRVSLVVMKPHC